MSLGLSDLGYQNGTKIKTKNQSTLEEKTVFNATGYRRSTKSVYFFFFMNIISTEFITMKSNILTNTSIIETLFSEIKT